MKNGENIKVLLCRIYGDDKGAEAYPELMDILRNYGESAAKTPEKPISGGDALLISYGNMLSPPGGSAAGSPAGESSEAGREETGLARLGRFLEKWNGGAFSFLHILPFHPYSSDDGFSVIDYRRVDGRFGSWNDIEALGRRFKLVFDFVINHGSVESSWFKEFLAGDREGWYLTRPENYDSARVVRPRTSPLLTPFTGKGGRTVHVWTTFSADQADYDFSNPRVLLEFTRILLEYARRGGRIVRLDAVAYLWKEDGTPCLHHPKTHGVVKLFRAIIDTLGLDLLILTETNVPHEQNISYFGGGDEAHMVYNFALPPLVLHAAVSGDAEPLRGWARDLPPCGNGRYFLNFLASHDGVGLTPAQGLVDDAAFAATLEEARNRGGLISYKTGPRGPVPYELNCSYADMVAPPSLGPAELRARAFLAAQGALLSLPGLPAVYFHSWIGSEAWKEGPERLGYNRAINREKPPVDRVEEELNDPGSFRSRVYWGFSRFLKFRKDAEAFDPHIPHRILDASGSIFAVLRGPDSAGGFVLCIQNLGNGEGVLRVPSGPSLPSVEAALAPWETRWLELRGGSVVKSLTTLR
jgi:sucrose phosphorylase